MTLAGAGSVMNSYSDVDGVPAGADPWLLTDLLRDEWGFAGTVVSDYWAVPFLATMHRVAADADDAGALALTAGIDVELPDTIGFGAGWSEQVRRGELPEELVDRAARRVLTQKAELGLLDPDWTPEASVAARGRASTSTRRPTGRWPGSWPSGRSSCSTPAPPCRCSATAGRRCAGWPWSGRARPTRAPSWAATPSPTTCCRATPTSGWGSRCRAPLDALRAELPDVEVDATSGAARCTGDDRSGFAAAVAAAREADLCVALRRRPRRTVRPRHLRRGLRRRGPAAARACRRTCSRSCWRPARRWSWSSSPAGRTRWATCTAGPPVWCRRSCPARRAARRSPACCPGGSSPSGKLPVQIPRQPGGQPGTYLQPPLGAENTGTSNLDPTPLFPFGHGRSYTTLRGRRPADQRRRGAAPTASSP